MVSTAREATGKYIACSKDTAESSKEQKPQHWGWVPITSMALMTTGWCFACYQQGGGATTASPWQPNGIPIASRGISMASLLTPTMPCSEQVPPGTVEISHKGLGWVLWDLSSMKNMPKCC